MKLGINFHKFINEYKYYKTTNIKFIYSDNIKKLNSILILPYKEKKKRLLLKGFKR